MGAKTRKICRCLQSLFYSLPFITHISKVSYKIITLKENQRVEARKSSFFQARNNHVL